MQKPAIRTFANAQPFASPRAQCVICSATEDIQIHHVGGRNHVGWFTTPLCRPHHELLTKMIWVAGVDMRYTPNNKVRLIRAMMAAVIFVWALLEKLAIELEREDHK